VQVRPTIAPPIGFVSANLLRYYPRMVFHVNRRAHILRILASVAAFAASAAAQQYPPRTTVIRPDHPLLLFAAHPVTVGAPERAADSVARIWADMPEELRPYAVLELRVAGTGPMAQTLHAVLTRLQALGIPVALRLAEEGQPALALSLIEPLLQEFSIIRGLGAAGLPFNEYISFGGDPALEWSAPTRWLTGAIDLAARYGRFITVHLDELHWLRIMANTQTRGLYESIRRHHEYVVPLNRHRPPHNPARMGGLIGSWLEGAVDHWGVELRSDWYHAARFVEPGMYGVAAEEMRHPSYHVRAMLLNGFMTGAEVYAFALPADLWFADNTATWTQVVWPTLERALQRGHIAQRAAVAERARVAYQLAPARNPQEFHLNLHDLDPVFDRGLMIHGVYGLERAGQVPELVLNTGRYYWIPIVSPYAPESILAQFDAVVRPGRMLSTYDWTALMNTYYVPAEDGTAFQCTVGDTTFIMNTRENIHEDQTFRLRQAPAPLRGLEARVGQDGVLLSWPLRDEDLHYTVFRRAWPEGAFEPIATRLGVAHYADPAPPQPGPAAYAVSAFTNETAAFAGTVGLGDYLVVDRFISPLVEEVVVDHSGGWPSAAPIKGATYGAEARLWWPNTAALPEDRAVVARAIADTIVQWDHAVQTEDLDQVMAVYASDYDAAGASRQDARRAFRWFFDRYTACRMDRQIRVWDFAQWPEERMVKVQLYLRFFGVAVSDPTGRFADLPAWFPASPTGEVWLTWRLEDDRWRIVEARPPLPDLKEILMFSSGPFDAIPLGAD
jgi:hypothetical protein